MSTSLEAKIVVLGSQGVGKTSLVHRYVKNAFNPATTTSTIGASFVTKRVIDTTTDTDVRLQIWDTAGQERFRSISRLYYRGANAGLLCYDITSEQSFEDMKGWLRELKEQVGISGEGQTSEDSLVIHVVGTKSDIVAEDPSKRKVPFEKTIAYVAEQLYPSQASTPPATAGMSGAGLQSPDSKRSSGFWGQDIGWDSCHEVNAKDGEGIEEIFRVIARKLVEQRNKHMEREAQLTTPGLSEHGGYFEAGGHGVDGHGSFRLGYGDKRRSWLGLPSSLVSGDEQVYEPQREAKKRGRCC
ncbi:putative ras-like gtp-binding [Phaeomoniella chlamydospora]|uniref:Putative ras-like gtp-binding n=1 Tax=Phaeomoniella chlamydospora TaxID=158046 RepID=A0A0G2HF03_PHACM|nr:putative ras-like gtp-binding [Phaeomoniella chlamydospora]